MIVIEDRKYLTWEDTYKQRKEARVDLYLGTELRAEVERRAEAVGLAVSPFVRDVVRSYVNTHPVGHDPQEG